MNNSIINNNADIKDLNMNALSVINNFLNICFKNHHKKINNKIMIINQILYNYNE